MRRWTVGVRDVDPRTDMTTFQQRLRAKVPGTIPLGQEPSRKRAVQKRLSHTRLTRLFAEQDAAEGAD